MRKKFTKSDLRDGMIVETRNSSKHIVLKDRIIGTDGAMGLEEYEEDLLLCEDSRDNDEDEYDIMIVYEFCSDGKYPSILDLFNRHTYLEIVWEREETTYMTVEEMKSKLMELTGETIEVKEDRKEGEWFLLDECSNAGVYCSVCHKKVYKEDYANQKIKSKFCPNCGARMKG